MKAPPQRRKGHAVARVTFIRHRATIEAEFRDGWSALAIYERHKADFSTISYRQFLRYVSPWRSPRQPGTPGVPTATRLAADPVRRRSAAPNRATEPIVPSAIISEPPASVVDPAPAALSKPRHVFKIARFKRAPEEA
jgi:hypothetical protein